jgi:hypothetical protein
MKKLSSLMAVLAIVLSLSNVTAKAPGSPSTTGFWLDVNVVNQIANSGAATLKIYAATDASGNSCYIIVGGDANYNTMGGQAFMQNSKGVCPPSCDFGSVSLSGENNAYIDGGQAAGYVNAYMGEHADAKNCARFTIASLSVLRGASAYIKVNIGSGANATGLKADGTASGKPGVLGTAVVTGL